ncbi:MAG: helix-turn-helix domain-containing protein [Rhodobacteraceae bacterium]|nr:helix-turn-helix domain-containing protein [Paracoccaceae bacterium]
MSFERLQSLAERYIEQIADVTAKPLPSLHVLRQEDVSAFEAVIYNPVICLILRGRKETRIGTQSVSLGQGDALLVSHDLPVVAKITEASPQAPYLALILALDIGIIRSLYEQVGEAVSEVASAKSLAASVADPTWLAPLERYLKLMDNPLEAQVLGPLILKEIHFQLLMSPIGGMLRNLLSVDSHASRIAKAILRIRASFREPLIVADLAELAGMSQSSFHEHFKSVTGTTPLQYQKDLRMIEARNLLASGARSVSVAGFEVGYESPTHFSRDYSRKFGCSPKHHLARAQ